MNTSPKNRTISRKLKIENILWPKVFSLKENTNRFTEINKNTMKRTP